MRYKIIYALAILIIGCKNFENKQDEKQIENQKQAKFDNFLKISKEKELSLSNDIQRKSFDETFENELIAFIDTNKVFVNWKGTIEEIETKEVGKSTTLVTCILSYKSADYVWRVEDDSLSSYITGISFHCSYPIATSKLKNDTLYNQLKNIADYSDVYFDGFIVRNINNKVVYNGDGSRYGNPQYKFNLLNVSLTKHKDDLSNNLNKNIETTFKVFDLLKQKSLNKISEKEWKTKTRNLPIDELEKKLSENEKQYSIRLKQYLLSDFLYK